MWHGSWCCFRFLGRSSPDEKETRPVDKVDARSQLQKDAQTRYGEPIKARARDKQPYHLASNNVPNSYKPYNTIDSPYATKSDSVYNKALEKAGLNFYQVVEDTRNRQRKIPSSNEIIDGNLGERVGNGRDQKMMWNLRSYEGVLDALTSGHKVYFSAKTKHCANSGARKKDKTFVGDYVDIYEIRKDFSQKQPNKLFVFSLRRLEHNRKGKDVNHLANICNQCVRY